MGVDEPPDRQPPRVLDEELPRFGDLVLVEDPALVQVRHHRARLDRVVTQRRSEHA